MLEYVNVKYIKLTETAKEPTKAHQSDSGFDLYCDEEIEIQPWKTKLVSTGIAIQMPPQQGIEAQVRSKSGLASKNGIFVLNSPGTIDRDYTGEIKVILANFNDKKLTLDAGSKVAQLVFCKIPAFPTFQLVQELGETSRGAKGFGSSGLK